MPSYPLVNGVRHSWAGVGIEVNGLTYGGITSINYEALLDGQPVRGAGPLVIGHTTGQASWTGDFEILLEEWNALMLTLAGPHGFMSTFFSARISVSNEGYVTSGMGNFVDTLTGCRIKSVGSTAQASSGDGLVKKVALLVTAGTINGVNPFPNMPTLSLGGVAGAAINGVRSVAGF